MHTSPTAEYRRGCAIVRDGLAQGLYTMSVSVQAGQSHTLDVVDLAL